MEKRRISILGDSISTFAGYTPEEAVFYDSYVQWETGVKSAMSYERIEKLGTNGIPDIILISAGCNDWGFCVLPEEFEEAYRTMLHRIKEQYPHADIYCATLPEGKQPQGETFFNIDSTISKRVYSDIIRENAQKAQVYIADLANVQEEYETVDGVHPNKAGMHTLARMWIREMKKFICK